MTANTHTHTHTHVGFYGLRGLSIGVMVFILYKLYGLYCPTPTLHLNLALTGDGAFLLSPQKTHTVWFISILNYGDTENVLINHFLLVIPMSYPCHYTNLCPHKPHKHARTHAHTHTHTHTHTVSCPAGVSVCLSTVNYGQLCSDEAAVLSRDFNRCRYSKDGGRSGICAWERHNRRVRISKNMF